VAPRLIAINIPALCSFRRANAPDLNPDYIANKINGLARWTLTPLLHYDGRLRPHNVRNYMHQPRSCPVAPTTHIIPDGISARHRPLEVNSALSFYFLLTYEGDPCIKPSELHSSYSPRLQILVFLFFLPHRLSWSFRFGTITGFHNFAEAP
jgi:hypothetical protein